MIESDSFYLIAFIGSIEGECSTVKYPLLPNEEVVLGRETVCDVIVDSDKFPTVSRKHAKIQSIEDITQVLWQVCDLKAANGTYINNSRVQGCHILKVGDRIMLGKDGPEFVFESEVLQHLLISEMPLEVADTFSPLPSMETMPEVPDTSTISLPFEPLNNSASKKSTYLEVTNVDKYHLRSLWDLTIQSSIITLVGHQDLVRGVAFSLDGKNIASASMDKTIKIWDIGLAKESQVLTGHKLAVNGVAFNPDQQILASGSADKTIKIWNLSSGEEVKQFTGHGMAVNTVTFSPNGKLLASGSADKTIKIWNLSSGEVIQTLTGHKMAINSVAISVDNQILASGSADRSVKLWMIDSGNEISTLPMLRSSINSIFFSPDGKFLAIFTEDKIVKIWDLSEEREIRVFSEYNWQSGNLAISPDGHMLACGGEDKTVKVWRL